MARGLLPFAAMNALLTTLTIPFWTIVDLVLDRPVALVLITAAVVAVAMAR